MFSSLKKATIVSLVLISATSSLCSWHKRAGLAAAAGATAYVGYKLYLKHQSYNNYLAHLKEQYAQEVQPIIWKIGQKKQININYILQLPIFTESKTERVAELKSIAHIYNQNPSNDTVAGPELQRRLNTIYSDEFAAISWSQWKPAIITASLAIATSIAIYAKLLSGMLKTIGR